MNYRPEIDGLRAVAVIPVIFFHAGYLSSGFIGVDIFFVISGYLITSIIINDLNNNRFSIANFYERRARRILPALVIVIATTVPFSWLYMFPEQFNSYLDSVGSVALFVSNFHFWQESGYFSTASELKPLLHTWSLSVEEQFYLLFPLFMVFLWKRARSLLVLAIVILAVCSFALSEFGSRHYPAANFFGLPTRAWELMAGTLCVFVERKPRHVLACFGVLFLVVAFSILDDQVPFPSAFTLIPVIGTVLVILYSEKTIVGAFLSAKAAVYVGLLSYSLYLWHQPIFAFMRITQIGQPSALQFLLGSILALGLAALTYQIVEKPFRDRKRFKRSFIFSASSVTILLFSFLGFGLSISPLSSQNPVIMKIGSYPKAINTECWSKLLKLTTVDNACTIGAPNVEPTVAIIGDSHAGMFVDALSAELRQAGKSGIDLTFFSCPPYFTAQNTKTNSATKACNNLRRDYQAQIQNGGFPKNVILSARWTLNFETTVFDNREGGKELGDTTYWVTDKTDALGYKKALVQDLITFIDFLKDHDKNVILVYPTPEAGWNVPLQVQKMEYFGNGADTLHTSYDVFWERNKSTIKLLNEIEGVARVFPYKYLCDDLHCLNAQGADLLYLDDDHLSYRGSLRAVTEIIKLLPQ